MEANKYIYKTRVRDLKFGMYVSKLDRPWLETPYALQGIHIKTMEDILELERFCTYVYIDIGRSEPHIVKKHYPNLLNEITQQKTVKSTSKAYKTPRADVNKTSFHGNQVYTDSSTIEEELSAATKIHHVALDAIKEIKANFEHNANIEIQDARNITYAMSDSIIRNPDAMLLLAELKSTGEQLYDNAMKNSILLVAFGRHLGLPRSELSILGLGGLLMDIGKLRLPEELSTKKGFYTSEENDLFKKHVTFGEEIIKQSENISQSVLDIISQHHEREDGSGYPRGINANQLNTYARMAAIIDCYQEITLSQPATSTIGASQTFNQLKKQASNGLNATLVEQFAHCLGFFPVGSLVELNSGEVAIVLTHSRSKRSLPTVMVILDADKKPYETPDTRDLRLLEPGTDGIPYTIVKDLPYGAFGIDAKQYYL